MVGSVELCIFVNMKNVIFFLAVALLSAASCRSENPDDIRRIDQVLNIYIDSLGQDMLDNTLPGSYISVTMNDVDGLTDNAPVQYNLRKDESNMSFIQYTAGARRILVESLPGNKEIYRSRIALNMRRQLNDSVQNVTNDTLVLNYTLTPQVFEISTALYNGVPVFTKTPGAANVIKINK